MEGDRITRKVIVFTYVGRTWNFDVELYIFINTDSGRAILSANYDDWINADITEVSINYKIY